LILASGRTAHAILILGALIWDYCLCTLVLNLAQPILPNIGKKWIHIFLASFFNAVYMLIFALTCPLLLTEQMLALLLVPIVFLLCRLPERIEGMRLDLAVLRALEEAALLGGIALGIALIREPLGFGSLSIPGGAYGIIEVFSSSDSEYYPIRIISSAGGALLLLGYTVSVFRRILKQLEEDN
jgi:hypothetical protein